MSKICFDLISWKTLIKLNNKLPTKLRSKTIQKSTIINNKEIFNMSSVLNMFNKSKTKPGFKRKIFFNKLPRILIKKNTYEMGVGLMKKTSEKSIVRLVKVAAGVKQ